MIEKRRGEEEGKVVVVNVKCAICHGDPGCWWSATLQTHSNGVKSGCQICFRQRRLSKKSSLTILLFTRSAIYRISYIFLYDIIFSYYILHYQKTYIYTQRNVSYKRNYTDIGLPLQSIREIAGRSVKAKPGAHELVQSKLCP